MRTLEIRSKLIVALLASSCAAAAAVVLPACIDHQCPDWAAPEAFELTPDADIIGAMASDWDGTRYLVAAGGVIIELDAGGRRHQPTAVELRSVALTDELLVAVGSGGTVVASPRNDTHWQTVAIGTTAELWQIVTLPFGDPRTVIVGDGVMFVYDPASFAWQPVTPPSGGWGDLRAIGSDGERLIAVGRAGVVWTAATVDGPWTREDPGTTADLTALTGNRAGGTGGIVVERDGAGTWRRIDLGTTADIAAMLGEYTLTSDGKVFEGASPDPIAAFAPGPRVLLWDRVGVTEALLALGAPGKHARIPDTCQYTDSGRPFIVDDAPRTAPVTRRSDWCARPPVQSDMSAGTGSGSAEFWSAAGLAEHASIASFARALLELMSLGAPPALLRETQAALADEIDHAALCFAQARRCDGEALGPGPLALDGRAMARMGDPVAIALAVFEEGCVGEGVAAAEVALQAAACDDADTRALLRRLADDETRHAALAWKTLRWLLDRHGETVAAPLRRRLARLVAPAGLADDLRADGLLSARERAALRRQVLREVVHPLASALLAGAPAATEVLS